MAEDDINYFSHLNELRNRIIVILVTITVLGIAAFFLSDRLISVVTRPLAGLVPSLFFMVPYEAFVIRLKIAMTAAIIVTIPLILFQLWSFVAPGLYERERKAILPVTFISSCLFAGGVLFAYFLMVPAALHFFLGFQTSTLRPLISAASYISFVLSLLLVMGCVFVTPVILTSLIAMGVLKTSFLSKHRKSVIVVAFILGAILTPTVDIVTQCLIAVPLWLLFEGSLLVGQVFEKRRRNKQKADPLSAGGI